MTAPEKTKRDRIAKMLIFLRDVQIVELDGGVCWPLGSFEGGTLAKNRDGEYWLCDAHALTEGRKYDRIQLPVEAVAATLIGDLKDDDVGYDSVELRIAESTYDKLAIHPGDGG